MASSVWFVKRTDTGEWLRYSEILTDSKYAWHEDLDIAEPFFIEGATEVVDDLLPDIPAVAVEFREIVND